MHSLCTLLLGGLFAGGLLTGPAWADEDQPLDGPLVLVADPAVKDPAFKETVLLVTPMPDGGYVGVIANRPTSVRLATLFPGQEPSQNVHDPVYFGGPMGGVLVALLKSEASPGGKSLSMGSGVYLAVEERVIDRIIEQTPNNARYLVGVVEWQPGELDEQLSRGVWQIAHTSADTVIHSDNGLLWRELSRTATRAPGAAAPEPSEPLPDDAPSGAGAGTV
jgi:putative transcriptional regulator